VGSAFALWYIGAYVMIAKVDLLSQVEGISTQGWVAVVMVYVYAVSGLPCSSCFGSLGCCEGVRREGVAKG
jgi:hypothetical protein